MSTELDPAFVAVHEDGTPGDPSVLDENDIAYDPTRMTMDLTKDEKRRTTALMLAIQAYKEFICRDAQMYREIQAEANRKGTEGLQPATYVGILDAAVGFDIFIQGGYSRHPEKPVSPPAVEEPTA